MYVWEWNEGKQKEGITVCWFSLKLELNVAHVNVHLLRRQFISSFFFHFFSVFVGGKLCCLCVNKAQRRVEERRVILFHFMNQIYWVSITTGLKKKTEKQEQTKRYYLILSADFHPLMVTNYGKLNLSSVTVKKAHAGITDFILFMKEVGNKPPSISFPLLLFFSLFHHQQQASRLFSICLWATHYALWRANSSALMSAC